jgi:hypothetical protein
VHVGVVETEVETETEVKVGILIELFEMVEMMV